MSNPLDPEVMSPAERLEEAASLLPRGLLRRRLRRAVGLSDVVDLEVRATGGEMTTAFVASPIATPTTGCALACCCAH